MTVENVLTGSNLTAVDTLATKTVNGVLDLLYTIVYYVISFLTTPAVLGAIAGLVIIYLFYRIFIRKTWIFK